ncbi:MAG: SPFH domain-containing protein [Lachnospiraceae bacterium]|nr:SPFH domain-containing protein [Candidatus Merdinaster equi]
MGLIKAALGSVGGVLADQWKEYFYCEALDADVLCAKGQKRVSGRSSNTKGSDNVISNGSVIAVADGQCMCIVDQGKVVDICAEPGEFTYDSSTEPSIFAGKFGTSLLQTFQNIGKRFTFGGEAPKDQRVYYFNTKEIIGNKFGTPAPVPFRVVDMNCGLDMDVSLKCFGEYSYRLTDPILFYTNVCGNVSGVYRRDELESQLRSEFLTALQPAFAKISEMGVRYSALVAHTEELAQAMKENLSAKWTQFRGIEIVSVGISSVKADEEDEKMIKELQRNAAFKNPTMAAAQLVGAQANAMQQAASNPNGAAMAFMGMGMAQQAGGMNAQNLYQMGAQMGGVQQPQMGNVAPNMGFGTAQQAAPAPAPAQANGWTCSCGTVNQGKFCQNCGAKKPAGAPQYKCDKCGWVPADPSNPPKFCPECGDPFGDEDIQ